MRWTGLGKVLYGLLAGVLATCMVVGAGTARAQRIFPSGRAIDTTWIFLPEIRTTDCIVVHEGYVSSYDTVRLVPRWVAYELTGEHLLPVTERNGSFLRDPQFPLRQCSQKDYAKSGYDRGHMAPAADMKWSEKAMRESFYMTNMCPQTPELNRRHWADLERKVRQAASRYGRVWIVSGPLTQSSGKMIGESGVDVPSAFFKAVMACSDGAYFSSAFVMRNDSTMQDARECIMSVDSLETILGLDLFHSLDDRLEHEAESSVEAGKWL